MRSESIVRLLFSRPFERVWWRWDPDGNDNANDKECIVSKNWMLPAITFSIIYFSMSRSSDILYLKWGHWPLGLKFSFQILTSSLATPWTSIILLALSVLYSFDFKSSLDEKILTPFSLLPPVNIKYKISFNLTAPYNAN